MKVTGIAAVQPIPQIEVTERNPEAAFREYIQTAQLSTSEWQALFIYTLRLKSARLHRGGDNA